MMIEITGYGRAAASDGKVTIAQTGQALGSVPGRAVKALEAGDLASFRRLAKRSRRLRLDVQRYVFGHNDCRCARCRGIATPGVSPSCSPGMAIAVSYGSATLALIRIPEGCHSQPGDAPGQAARAVGLSD